MNRKTYELHLIAPSGDEPTDSCLLGTFDSEGEACSEGQRYLRAHPDAWLQVCEPCAQGRDVSL